MNLYYPAGIQAGFEVANGGQGELEYRIEWDADWLEIGKTDCIWLHLPPKRL